MPNPIGIDVSRWQDNNETTRRIDWNQAKSAGAKFAFIKCGQNTWLDEDFAYNWRESKRAGIPRGAYWYLDNRSPASTQAERFYNALAATGDTGDLPPAIDFEMRPDAPLPSVAQNRLANALAYMETHDHRPPILYTAPAYWLEYGSAAASWLQYPLWLAHYTEDPEPRVPPPWPTWTFWQYTNKGPGPAYGVESLQIDLDQYNPGHGFDGPILRILTDHEKVARLWAAHPELHPD